MKGHYVSVSMPSNMMETCAWQSHWAISWQKHTSSMAYRLTSLFLCPFTLSDNNYDNNTRSPNTFVADIIDEALYAEELGMHSAWIARRPRLETWVSGRRRRQMGGQHTSLRGT